MSVAIRNYVEQHSPVIDRALRSLLPVSRLCGADCLNEAIDYAIFAGGKRIRPVLALLAAEICGATPDPALPIACAVEFLHAASLALDDLPAMDDAGLRRGRDAVHIRYGEDVAILASLALFNQAYGIFARYPNLLPKAVQEIGANGMIGGQVADICGDRSQSRTEKTTALMRLTMTAGAIAAGAGSAECETLAAFGHAIGEAYQICDDLADAFAPDIDLGKTAGQDRRHGRFSILSGLGAEAACKRAAGLIHRACETVFAEFGDSLATRLLADFANEILVRGFELVKVELVR